MCGSISTYTLSNWIERLVKILVCTLGGKDGAKQYIDTPYQKIERICYNPDGSENHIYSQTGADKDYFDMQIYLKDEDNHTYNGSNRGVYPIVYYDIYDVICRASTGVNTYSENKTVKDITMKS